MNTIDIRVVYIAGGDLYNVDSTRSLLSSKGHPLSLYVNNRGNPAARLKVEDGDKPPLRLDLPAGYYGQLDTPEGAFFLTGERVAVEAEVDGTTVHFTARFHRGSGTAFFQQETRSQATVRRTSSALSSPRRFEAPAPAHEHSPPSLTPTARLFSPKSTRTRTVKSGAKLPIELPARPAAKRAAKSPGRAAKTKVATGAKTAPLVEIYSRAGCPYCVKAKELLNSLGVNYKETDFAKVANYEQVKDEMLQRSGGVATVPQIFVGGKHLGGYTELDSAVKSGLWKKLYKA